MPEDLIAGAEKPVAPATAGVPPTPEQTAPAAPAQAAAATAPEVGTPGAESPTPEKTGTGEGDPAPADAKAREGFIPRERFDEVHGRAQQAEAERETARKELAETREAATLGFRDVAQFRAVAEEAKQFGFADAGTYLSALQQQQRAEQEITQIQGRDDLTDDVKADLVQAKQINLQAQQQLMQSRALTQQMQRQTLETAITDARRDLGLAELPKGMEDIFRKSSPEVVRSMVAEMKPLLKQQTQAAVSQYAAAKETDRQTPAPEGRGGNPPPAAGAKTKFKSVSFAQLLHGGGKTG